MQRKITGFHQDEQKDWVAELDCFHGQHVRHKPPFFNRPWVESEAGRASMLGVELDCVLCDRLEWPAGLVAYKRTSEFTQQTIPQGLQKDHVTKGGTWGQIHVVSGTLIYTVQQPTLRSLELSVGVIGNIPPGMAHHVAAKDEVRFYVEFFTALSKHRGE
jgi:tellurite resistance-related uncharacterized protein